MGRLESVSIVTEIKLKSDMVGSFPALNAHPIEECAGGRAGAISPFVLVQEIRE